MSGCSVNETRDAVKRTIVATAVLLASALSAYAGPVTKHRRVASGHACHQTVLWGADAVRAGLGMATGAIPMPRKDCPSSYTSGRESERAWDDYNRNMSLGIY
jgi:hypothetical protein